MEEIGLETKQKVIDADAVLKFMLYKQNSFSF
jgi:hypothetical protein